MEAGLFASRPDSKTGAGSKGRTRGAGRNHRQFDKFSDIASTITGRKQMLLQAAEWYNYPGLELWKFANLAIFPGVGIYILRKPISQALQSRRGAVKQQLITAQ